VLIHHTDCGLLTFTDEDFKRQVREDVGEEPPWPVGTFTDLEESVRDSIERIASSPFVPRKDSIRGFVYDVSSGRLNEVSRR
jgi:carbonic anhydrase